MLKTFSSFDKVYYLLAVFYLIYFYIIPLIVIENYNNLLDISYKLNINNSNIIMAWSSLLFFIVGFIMIDTIKIMYKKKVAREIDNKINNKINKVAFYFIFLYLLILLFTYHNTSVENIYEIRSGLLEGSWLNYFVSLILQGVKYSIIFIFLKSKVSKVYILIFLFISMYVELNSGVGRFNFLVDFTIMVMLIFNLSAYKIGLVLIVGFFLSMPIIFSLKSIIYMIASDTFSLINIMELLERPFDFSLYINNFGHPVVSLLMIEPLIEKIGYRYFYDYIHDFLFFLRVIGLDVDGTLTYYNSKNLIGKFESIVPPGYFAYGYMQLSYLGVFFSGVFYRLLGLLGKKIYFVIGSNSEAAKFLIAFLFANSFYHGEVRIMILTLFLQFGVILIVLNFLSKKR